MSRVHEKVEQGEIEKRRGEREVRDGQLMPFDHVEPTRRTEAAVSIAQQLSPGKACALCPSSHFAFFLPPFNLSLYASFFHNTTTEIMRVFSHPIKQLLTIPIFPDIIIIPKMASFNLN